MAMKLGRVGVYETPPRRCSMMKRFFLLAAVLGLTALGTAPATEPEPAPAPEWGTCKWYCGSTPYNTLAQCAAAWGGSGNCDEIC
jgi:hypothetical protein